MTGSHIDTVRTGGRFDGNLGVLAGLEVIETLDQRRHRDRARRSPSAFFTDEEGARFAPDMLGSLVYVGGMALEEALDVAAADDGARLGDELDAHRLRRPAAVPAAASPHAYVELHIEQGPILEDEGVDDRRRHRRAGHLVDRGHDHRPVGPRRHDADAAAPRRRLRRGRGSSTFVRDLTAELGGTQVATVGRLDLSPEPGQRRARDGDVHRRPAQHRRGHAAGGRAADGRRARATWRPPSGVTVATRSLARFEPVEFDPDMVDLVEQVATAARPLHAADAERRRPRRADAGAGVPDGDDLRAVGRTG